MIEETYCTFEQAKRLKEKGFPQDMSLRYSLINYDHDSSTGRWGEDINPYERHYNIGDTLNTVNEYWDSRSVAQPTLSLVQKWLKEEKGIDIIVQKLIRTPKIDSFYMAIVILEDITQETFAPYNTYEEALSSGISKALELI